MKNDSSTQLLSIEESVKDVASLRKCVLKVIEGPDQGKTINLNKKSTKIGKNSENDFVLTDETISRNHVEISLSGDAFMVSDLDSTNGTTINELRVKEAYLSPGDQIKIGSSCIEFIAYDEKVKIEPSDKHEYGAMVGKSRKMRQIFSILDRVATTLATVIIEGETGTGKELVARAIHDNSHRKDKPFIVFDCSAVASNLIESELFGHEKGAFTGALKQHKGAFEAAQGGTIFLDEMGELNLDLQPKLLRALEQREVKKLGSNQSVKVDVRVVCATNRDLKEEVSAGRFREDLYYRLSVVKVNLPPLRERAEDIPLIVERLLGRSPYNREGDDSFRVTHVDDEALRMLQRYIWPGNIRELNNIIERAVSMAEADKIDAQHLSLVFQEADGQEEEDSSELEAVDVSLPFKDAKQKIVEGFEKQYIQNLLEENNYNVSKSARQAGIDRKHLRNLIKKYELQGED